MYKIDKSKWVTFAEQEKLRQQKLSEMKEISKQLIKDFKEYVEVTNIKQFYMFLDNSFPRVNGGRFIGDFEVDYEISMRGVSYFLRFDNGVIKQDCHFDIYSKEE